MYDALDRQRSANGTAVNYDGFSQTPAIETVGGSDRIYSLDPFGQPRGLQNGASSQFLTDDGHGNIGAVTNGSQSMTCSTQYDPWGRPPTGQATPCTGTGTTDSDLFYRRSRRDATTGTYQFGSRTYDPTKAGFSSSDVYRADSASRTQGLQLDPLTQDRYNYVNGDPVNLVDFDGHKFCAQGDPNPDCDAYRPGTTYQGWKDEAYYDNQVSQRQRADYEAAVRYAKWQAEQKQEAEKKRHECSLNPLSWGNCASQAAHAIDQCFTGPGHTCTVIAVGVLTFAACEAVTAGAGTIGCAALSGVVAGGLSGALDCPHGQSQAGCVVGGAVVGGAAGLLGGVLGEALAPVAGRIGGAIASRAGPLLSRGLQAFTSGVGRVTSSIFGRSAPEAADATVDIPAYARSGYSDVSQGAKDSVIGNNQTCVYCGKNPSTQVDHINSLKNDWQSGGWNDDPAVRSARVNDPENLTGACGPCNAGKGARTIGQGTGQWWPSAWGDEWWRFGGGPG